MLAGVVFLRPPSLAHRWPPSCYVFMWYSNLGVPRAGLSCALFLSASLCVSSSPFLIRTPVLLKWGPS